LARSAGVDERWLMPAWRRYTRGFYTAAGDALTDATARHANIVIIGGGYGIVTAVSTGGGAMVTVPRTLGAALRAFWYRAPHLLPDSITVESLR
jgi:hypothetical protein